MKKISFVLLSFVFVAFASSYSYAAPVNLLANGNFEAGVMSPWTTYGDMISLEVVSTGAVEGSYCLHIVCSAKGANFWDGGLQHAGHTFDNGKIYTLSAFLKSPDKLEINFKPELAADPWSGYGDKVITMTENWEQYYTTTPPMPNDVSPATITFHIAFDVGEFWMDDVQFYEGGFVSEPPSVVKPEAKLATTWGKMRAE